MRRSADNHRAEKAIYHLEAAQVLLRNIKWENVTVLEEDLLKKAKDSIEPVIWLIRDLLPKE